MRNIFRNLLLIAGIALTAATAIAQSGPYQYFSVTPCRVADTRNAVGTNGGPMLDTTTRNFQVRGNCAIPLTAHAVTINVTVTGATTGSWLTIWPSDVAQPFISTMNFDQTVTALANGAIVGLSANTNTADLSVRNAVGSVNVIIDVTGYFQ